VNIEHLTAKASKTIAKEKENKGSTYNAIPLASGVLGSTTSSITSWLVDCPSFEKCLVRFMVTTYQSYRICEEPTFRGLCRSLNKKAPILSREKLTSLVKDEYYVVLQKLKGILVDREFAITTDAWTSVAKIGYVTLTCHFICRSTWVLHSTVMGLFEKKGPLELMMLLGIWKNSSFFLVYHIPSALLRSPIWRPQCVPLVACW